jgi:Protein of unknown function (DUF3047)
MAARLIASALVAAALATYACAEAPLLTPFPATGDTPPAPWHLAGLPHQKKPFTRFTLDDVDGRRALRVEAESSYGNLVHPLVLTQTAVHLVWQWRVDELLPEANLRDKNGDDTALKVCVFFDLPIERVPFFERQLLRFARTQTPEPLPGATICYVWDAHLPVGIALSAPNSCVKSAATSRRSCAQWCGSGAPLSSTR